MIVHLPLTLQALLILQACTVTAAQPALDDGQIADINRRNLGWTAARNPRFEGLSKDDFRGLLGVILPDDAPNCPPPSDGPAPNVPDSFDARQKWPKYVHPIRNQEQCGSCWAFAASEVLSDRLAISSNGEYNKVLSPQALVSCDDSDMACQGGFPTNAANFLVHTGIPEDKCEPYIFSSPSQVSPDCPTRCIDGSYRQVYKYQHWNYSIGEDAMKAALQTGPVAVSMVVCDGFQSYKSGVYSAESGCMKEGYHAVKLVGYGTTGSDENPASTPYWIVANSWGPDWGEDGYFRIKRGDNNCGIEQGATQKGCPIFGVPLIPTPSPPPPPPAPASYHYGQPPCRSDEVLTLSDLGSMCTPPCGSNGECPSDTPPGTKAKPQCTTNFNKTSPVCALHCHGGCPAGASCAPAGALPFAGGWCTWEQASSIVV